MTKHKISQFQMNNLHAALEGWKTEVKPESVCLATFRPADHDIATTPHCGSTACFGGWLPYMQHFRNLGVEAELLGGRPLYKEHTNPIRVSYELFGWDMFAADRTICAFTHTDEGVLKEENWHRFSNEFYNVSDYAHIIDRLNYAILNSEVA